MVHGLDLASSFCGSVWMVNQSFFFVDLVRPVILVYSVSFGCMSLGSIWFVIKHKFY